MAARDHLDAPGDRKKKWRDDADLEREMCKGKLKRERRSKEILRRERGENNKVEKEEDNANAREKKNGVGALPSSSSLISRNNKEEADNDDNARGGELGSDQARDETIDDT